MGRLLFIYGTMKKGHRNEARLGGDCKYIGRATVMGDIYKLPFLNFPIFRPAANHLVHGELWDVGEYSLREIDRAEKWYKRKGTVCDVIGGSRECCDIYEGFKYLPRFLGKDLHGEF